MFPHETYCNPTSYRKCHCQGHLKMLRSRTGFLDNYFLYCFYHFRHIPILCSFPYIYKLKSESVQKRNLSIPLYKMLQKETNLRKILAEHYSDLTTVWTNGIRSPTEAKYFPLAPVSYLMDTVFISPGVKGGRSVTLTIYPI